MTAEAESDYRERIVDYMRKAMREAKVVTSWLNPSDPHEQAMSRFVRAIVSADSAAFRSAFLEFHARIARYGIYNSLAQLALKVTAPGIPDFYQGTELWTFSLVDPDNRRPVDYGKRRTLLHEVCLATHSSVERRAFIERVMMSPFDDRLKLYATMTLLRWRAEHRDLVRVGAYEPIETEGARRDHVFAFLRKANAQQTIIVVPRLIAGLLPDPTVPPIGERVWGDTRLQLPDGAPCCFRDALTGERVRTREGRRSLRIADVLDQFPIGCLDADSA
jgi:(1->4)-alpha-D-glucan 1-alpha-D-glucosylmutase